MGAKDILELVDRHGLALVMLVLFMIVIWIGIKTLFKLYLSEKKYNQKRDEEDLTTIIKTGIFIEETKNKIGNMADEIEGLRKQQNEGTNDIIRKINEIPRTP